MFDTTSFHPDQTPYDDHISGVGVDTLTADQVVHGAHKPIVGGSPFRPGQSDTDAHVPSAGAGVEPSPEDAILNILAGTLDDIERVRIATENRLRSLIEDPKNENDTARGLKGTSFEDRLTATLNGLKGLEHSATLDLQRAVRIHPLYPFIKRVKGLGDKQAARLLAAIGDPAERPNPAKLWQYAGHGDPERSRRRKGLTVQFSPTAKMRLHLVSESVMKQRCGACQTAARAVPLTAPAVPSPWRPPDNCTCHQTHPYRAVYDRERAKWQDRETSDAHKHAHALRVLGKTLLRDMWRYARRTEVL